MFWKWRKRKTEVKPKSMDQARFELEKERIARYKYKGPEVIRLSSSEQERLKERQL